MDSKEEKLGLVGAGNMATALVRGLVESGLYEPENVMTSDIRYDQLLKIADSFGIRTTRDNKHLVRESHIVLLAVKPQSMREVLEDIREAVREEQLLISIAAGVPLKKIDALLGKDIPLIRAMPNTPALVLSGMIVLAPKPGVSQYHMEAAKRIFNAVGKTAVVEEGMMDAVTALSGSGPGFIFRIMECFIKAGEDLGFDRDTSTVLVLQTFLGSARLANEWGESLSHLKDMVTSPGGTTEAGLAVLEKGGVAELVVSAIRAARDRGIELGKM